MDPIFKLGQSRNTVFSSGHKLQEMVSFLNRYFGVEGIEMFMNHSLLGMAGQPQSYRVTVSAHPDVQYINEVMQFVRE